MEDPRIFANLVKGRQSRAVIVRVVRKWTLYQNTGQGAPLHVGMVLADEEGEAMYAQIDEELIQKKAVLFEPGKVYAVKKFMVDNNKRTHKTVDRELMINITEYTTVEVIRNPPDGIPHYIYNITPLPVIKPTPIIEKYLDVVGYLVKYEALQVFIPKNREKVKMLREIYIKDLSDNVMKITLWGDHAVNFNISNIYDPQAGNLIVCLVLGYSARKDFKNNDKTALTGSTSCSYYFNPTIPETAAFQNRFKDIPLYIEMPLEPEEPFQNPPPDIQLPEKTVAQLNNIDPYDEDVRGPFKCGITISSVLNTKSWWYKSCRPCKKSAEQQVDRTYRCQKCRGSDTVPRYTLTFIGKDETGEARFFAYDEEAQQMIQKDCESIMVSAKGRDGLPQAMQNIITKKFVLSVDLSKESAKGAKYRQYEIKAVLEKPSRRPLQQDSPTSAMEMVPADPTMPPADHTQISTNVVQTPQRSSELLQLELPSQNTPAPTSDTDDDVEKQKNTRRSSRNATGNRRSLAKQMEDADNSSGLAETSPSDELQNKASVPPKPKRCKGSASKAASAKATTE